MGVLDFVFPKKCLGCGRVGVYICDDCVSKVNKPGQICPVCTKASIDGVTHFSCRKPQSLDGVYSVWENKGVVKKTIKTLKYEFAEDLTRTIAKLTIIKLREKDNSLPTHATIIPIPLHPKRLKWRGFNQSEEVSKYIAKYMNYEFVPDLLIRTKNKKPQADLDKAARLQNMRGVFALNPKLNKSKIQNKIIIFDDIWTTGATIREAGKLLKRSGIETVWGLTIAH